MKIKKKENVEYFAEKKGNVTKESKNEGNLTPGVGQVRIGVLKKEDVKIKRGRIKDGEIDTDIFLENRPISIVKGERRIGCSKGATVPTVAYGNIKISVWEERIVPDKDREAHKTLNEISEYLDEWLQAEVNEATRNL